MYQHETFLTLMSKFDYMILMKKMALIRICIYA